MRPLIPIDDRSLKSDVYRLLDLFGSLISRFVYNLSHLSVNNVAGTVNVISDGAPLHFCERLLLFVTSEYFLSMLFTVFPMFGQPCAKLSTRFPNVCLFTVFIFYFIDDLTFFTFVLFVFGVYQ